MIYYEPYYIKNIIVLVYDVGVHRFENGMVE
jgi:hypothetical protein